MSKQGQAVLCTIGMILIEFDHFNGIEDKLSEEEIREEAIFRFKEILLSDWDDDVLDDYIQTQFVETPT